MRDTGQPETWHLRLIPQPGEGHRYIPDATFDPEAFREWLSRARADASLKVVFAVKDDPATFRILDGDLRHFNDSLQKRFDLVAADGTRIPVFRSESTLGWEMIEYLKLAVGGLSAEAFRADPDEARAAMYSIIDTVDLQLKATDFAGATATLEGLIQKARERWLRPGEREAEGAVCAFRKLQNLLVPGSGCP